MFFLFRPEGGLEHFFFQGGGKNPPLKPLFQFAQQRGSFPSKAKTVSNPQVKQFFKGKPTRGSWVRAWGGSKKGNCFSESEKLSKIFTIKAHCTDGSICPDIVQPGADQNKGHFRHRKWRFVLDQIRGGAYANIRVLGSINGGRFETRAARLRWRAWLSCRCGLGKITRPGLPSRQPKCVHPIRVH